MEDETKAETSPPTTEEKPTEEQAAPAEEEKNEESPAAEEKKEEEAPAAEEAKTEEAPAAEEAKTEEAPATEDKKEEEEAPAATEEKKEDDAPVATEEKEEAPAAEETKTEGAAATTEEANTEEVPAAAEEKTEEAAATEEPAKQEEEPTAEEETAPAAEEEKKEEEAVEENNEEEAPSPAPAAAAASGEGEGAPLTGLTREEFIRQMGLTSDDMADPSRQAMTEPSTEETAALREAGGVPPVLLDEVFFRNTDIADPLMVKKSQITADSEYRLKELDKFRTTRSAMQTGDGSGLGDSENGGSPGAKHTKDDTEAAVNYRAEMLSTFRTRKQDGTSKTLPDSPSKRSPKKEQEADAAAPAASE